MIAPYYQDEKVTIYNADNREVLPYLPKADLVLTDPPYQQSNSGAGLVGRRSTYTEIRSNLSEFNPSWLCGVLLQVCKAAHGYIFTAKDILPEYCEFMRAQGWGWDVLTYGKRNPLPAKNNKYLSDSEFIVFFRQPSACYFNNSLPYKNYFKIKMTNCEPSQFGHPTEKDVGIISSMIEISSRPLDVVLDLYCGSGTTLVAAAQLGRRAIGIEIEERYCEIAARRIEAVNAQPGLFTPEQLAATQDTEPAQSGLFATVGE